MIKNWNLFKESVDEKSKIDDICDKYGLYLGDYTINDDLSIDISRSLMLIDRGLEEIPLNIRKVSGDVDISGNLFTNLKGCPKWVGGYFSCSGSKLTSLEFGPEWVEGSFYCHSNKLTSFDGLPNYIGGITNCNFNEIWTFKGIPDNFRGILTCIGNPIWNIWNLFKSSGDIEFFNDCHIVREPETPDGEPIVILERLNYFLDVIGKPPVEKVEGYINI
jgi:hypothetical protein